MRKELTIDATGRVKPLDIVRTPMGGLAVVTEVNFDGRCSIDYLMHPDNVTEYNAWWDPKNLTVLDSIPRLLSNAMAHPFGSNRSQGDRFFPRARSE